MHFVVIGLNHTTAPVDVRERLYVSEGALPGVIGRLKGRGVTDSVVLSTCNRTEIYARTDKIDDPGAAIMEVLTEVFGLVSTRLSEYTYTFFDAEAYRHLFLVSSGLDSMVVGEPQILGQVKEACRCAASHEGASAFTEKIFQRAYQVAKRVRTETKIGYNPVSISGMAVELARKIFGDLSQKKILVIGAGEMCEIAMRTFKKEGIQEIFITNRTFQKAQLLAEEVLGTPHPFDEIPQLLLRVDMVLSSTGAEQPIINRRLVSDAMKKRKSRPLFFIDIAVPRDIDPAVNDLENVYLYDIDDLRDLSEEHLANRLQEAEKARAIVEEEVEKFEAWLAQLDRSPLITQIVQKLEEMRTREVKKALSRMKQVDDETAKQIDSVTRSIVNKMIHPHLKMIKQNGNPVVLDMMKNLFSYEGDDETDVDPRNEGK